MKTTLFNRTAVVLMAVGLIGSSGCEKALEINPPFAQTVETALRSPADIENFMTGAYASLLAIGNAGTNATMIPELIGNPNTVIRFRGTFSSYGDVAALAPISTNAEAQAIWTASYSLINRCNIVLQNLGVVTDPNQSSRIRGEALALRAYAYFNLARNFCVQYTPATAGAPNSGVPLQLTAIVDGAGASDARLPRATIGAVYTQIVSDLQTAVTALTGQTPVHPTERMNESAARALLARVLVQRGDAGDYAAALALANTVINDLGPLPSDPMEVYVTDNAPEAIWELGQNPTNSAVTGNSGLAAFFGAQQTGGRGDVTIEDGFSADLGFETADVRAQTNPAVMPGQPIVPTTRLNYIGAGLTIGSARYTFKYWPANPPKNTILIRLAEMYLIRAECNQRLSSSVGAAPLADINEIRARVGASAAAAAPLDTIFRERRRELFLEGHYLYDQFRRRVTDPTVTVRGVDPFGTTTQAQRLILPIPRRETDINSGLVQNPGY